MQVMLGRHWHHLPIKQAVELLDSNLERGLDLFEWELLNGASVAQARTVAVNGVVVVESWVSACWATWQWNWKNGCAAGEALPRPRSTEHTSSR